MKRREITFPTMAGLLLALGGLVSGLWLLGGRLEQSARADVQETPTEIRVVNVSDTSFTVSWLTEKATSGFVQYGESGESVDLVVSDERDQLKGAIGSYFTHFVTVKGLKAETDYDFKVGSGRKTYDRGGQNYIVTTAKSLDSPPAADVAYGQVVTGSGEPAEGAVVFLSIAGMAQQAALVKATGAWVIPLSTARSEDLAGFAVYDEAEDEVEIVVSGGPMGTSTVAITTQNDSPVPDITLGQSVDYLSQSGEEEEEKNSKFTAEILGPASESAESTSGAEFELLTPRFGEKVNSLRPQIVGEAPPGTEVTVEIQSDPVTGKVTAGANGRFSFSVPSDLIPGEHTITITAIIDGVNKKVTRKFTVFAAGESSIPAFSATPSATLAPSPTNTPKPSPTIIPSPTSIPVGGNVSPTIAPSPTIIPTPTIKPTIVPSPTPVREIASDSGIPQAGGSLPTVLILAMGAGLILVGGWGYRRA